MTCSEFKQSNKFKSRTAVQFKLFTINYKIENYFKLICGIISHISVYIITEKLSVIFFGAALFTNRKHHRPHRVKSGMRLRRCLSPSLLATPPARSASSQSAPSSHALTLRSTSPPPPTPHPSASPPLYAQPPTTLFYNGQS